MLLMARDSTVRWKTTNKMARKGDSPHMTNCHTYFFAFAHHIRPQTPIDIRHHLGMFFWQYHWPKKLRNMGYVQCYSKLSIVALHLQYASVSHATYIRYWSRIVTYNGQSSVSYETALTLIKAEMIIYCRIIKCVFALTSHKMMKINEQDRHALCTHTHTH